MSYTGRLAEEDDQDALCAPYVSPSDPEPVVMLLARGLQSPPNELNPTGRISLETLPALDDISMCEIERLAEEDDQDALCALGCMYGFGKRGKELDFGKSQEYFQRAIDKGSIDAIYWIGHLVANRAMNPETDRNLVGLFKKFTCTE